MTSATKPAAVSSSLKLDPSQSWARFDAPTKGGPWALNSAGQWFEVKTRAPGSEVLDVDGRKIYVPAEHPSVRVKENQYGTGDAHKRRWSSQQMRAANAALLRGSFRDLFFNISPRGSGPEGIGAGRAFDGTPEDYDSEGGNLYPDLKPSDPKALELTRWYQANNFDARYGYDKGLTLNWLRVFTDPSGFRRYKAWSPAEAKEYADRWHLAKDNFVCGGDEVINIANQTIGRQRERQAAQTEGDYSVHWPWIIGPLSQCAPTSSSRRRKTIKKAAAVGALVTAAVFLGPIIAGAVKGGGAAGAAAGAGGSAAGAGASAAKAVALGAKAAKGAGIAAKITKGASIASSVVGVASVARGASDAATMASAAAATPGVIEKTVKALNTARTIKAVADGQVPPPPIDISGSNFTEWGTAIASEYLANEARKAGQELQGAELAAQERELQQMIAEYQARAVATLPVPSQSVPMYPMPQVPAPIQQSMAAGLDADTLKTVAMVAVPALALLLSQR